MGIRSHTDYEIICKGIFCDNFLYINCGRVTVTLSCAICRNVYNTGSYCIPRDSPFCVQALSYVSLKCCPSSRKPFACSASKEMQTGEPKHRLTHGEQLRAHSPFLWRSSGCIWCRTAVEGAGRSKWKWWLTFSPLAKLSPVVTKG